MTAKLISTIRFLEYGKPAPAGSKFKGIINTQSLIGWNQYTTRDDANEKSKGSHFDYQSEREGHTKTFSSSGWLDTEDKINVFKNQLGESFNSPGDLFWDSVVSLKDFEDSYGYGLTNANDYAIVTDKAMTQFFKSVGLDPGNMMWWMNYHINTDNPHIHVSFLEKVKTRSRGKFSEKQIKMFKATFFKEMIGRQEFKNQFGYDAKLQFQYKDLSKKNLKENIKSNLQQSLFKNDDIQKKIDKLYSTLPKEGRLQINSTHMIDYRDNVYEIVDLLLEDETIKTKFDDYVEILNELDSVRSKGLNTTITTIKDKETQKIKVELANMILQNYITVKDDYDLKSNEKINVLSETKNNSMTNEQKTDYYLKQLKPKGFNNPFEKDMITQVINNGLIDNAAIPEEVTFNLEKVDSKNKVDYLDCLLHSNSSIQASNSDGSKIIEINGTKNSFHLETFNEKNELIHQETVKSIEQVCVSMMNQNMTQFKPSENVLVIPNHLILHKKDELILMNKEKKMSIYVSEDEQTYSNDSYTQIKFDDQQKYLVRKNNRFVKIETEEVFKQLELESQNRLPYQRFNTRNFPNRLRHKQNLSSRLLSFIDKAQHEAELGLQDYLKSEQQKAFERTR